MGALDKLLQRPGVVASRPPTARQLELLKARAGFAIPDAVRQVYETCGTAAITPLSMRLLSPVEAARSLDSWRRYGFEPGYLPLAEDRNGDLYCVRCAPPGQGQVFHLLWAGEDLQKFDDVERFLEDVLASLPPG